LAKHYTLRGLTASQRGGAWHPVSLFTVRDPGILITRKQRFWRHGLKVLGQRGSSTEWADLVSNSAKLDKNPVATYDCSHMADPTSRISQDKDFPYRRLFEVAPEPMWVYDLETLQFLAVNDAAIRHYGYPRETFLTMTIRDIRPPEDVPALLDNIAAVSQGLDFAGIWQHQLANGTTILVEITSHTLEFAGRPAEVVLAHDVTESQQQAQQQAQLLQDLQAVNQQLQEREAALTVAQSVGNMGSWQLRLDSEALTWSDYIFTIFGISRAEFGGTFEHFFDFIHPDDRAHFMVEQQAALAGDRPLDVQHRIICPDGQVKIVHERAELIDTPQGRILAGTVQDITERVEAKAQLGRSATLLKMAGRVARFGGWSVDLSSQQSEWSEEVCAIHELPSSGSITVSVEAGIQFYAPEYRDRIATLFNRCAIHGIPFDDELQLITAKGNRIWVRAIGQAVRDRSGKITRVEGAFQDISVYKQAEQAIIQSQERFRQLADALPQIVWTANPDGTVDYANRSYYHYRGVPEETIDLQAQDWLTGLHPEDVARCLETWREAVSTQTTFTVEYRIQNADGDYRWHTVSAQPIADQTGTLVKWYGTALDIHDLKRAEAAASDLAHRLSLTLESISDGFVTLNRDWQFTFVNGKAEILLRRSRAELMGQNIWEVFSEAVGTQAYTEYHQAMATGNSTAFEFFYPPLDAWFDVSVYPSAEGLGVYFRDVTQRRLADAQLHLLQTATARINDIILITEAEPLDEPGPRILFVNDAFERRTGYQREEVIGQTPRLLQGPATQRHELDRIRTALEQWRPVRAELINYTKDGSSFWLELDITPLFDEAGRCTHWVAIQRDITERKQIEEQLAQQAALLDETQDAIIVWDLNLTVQFWNRSAEQQYGWTVAEATHQSVQALIDGGEHFDEAEATVHQQGVWSGMMLHRRKNGSTLMAECTWTLVCDQAGAPQAIMAVNTDVTERLALERQLQQAQRMEAIGQLTGGIAHDFNNLLTVIIGNAELLAEQLTAESDLHPLAETTVAAAHRGADLTHRLLAFARRQALEPKVTQVNTLLAEMEPLLRRTLGFHTELEIVQGGGLWPCLIDPSQLETALINLCLNARDAMAAGGRLTLETANAHLNQDYADEHTEVAAGQYVRIAVTDSGQGMTPETMAQVFEPFFTTKESGRGTGLGLSMVYGFVKQSGGHIKLYSEVGQGTTVKLYLPRSYQAQEPNVPTPSNESAVVGGTETILVVEDDEMVRQHVEQQLQSLGYQVITARSGGEALQALYRAPHVDLLFTDVMMPGGMNGAQLAQAAQQLQPTLKVLYTSGYTENAIVHQGRLDPGLHLLAKPYRLQDLARMVRVALSSPGAP